jgi:hypothetical protein
MCPSIDSLAPFAQNHHTNHTFYWPADSFNNNKNENKRGLWVRGDRIWLRISGIEKERKNIDVKRVHARAHSASTSDQHAFFAMRPMVLNFDRFSYNGSNNAFFSSK